MAFSDDALSLPVTRHPTTRRSRCFRTTADGRIALVRDWPRLFAALQPLPELALQTRHAHARLIAVTAVPELHLSSDRLAAVDATGALHLRLAHWAQAWGRVAPCPCCDSPGRIEICNRYGLDFLQLCAVPGTTAQVWAGCLGPLSLDQPFQSALPLVPGVFPTVPPVSGRPPRAAPASALATFFTTLIEHAGRVRCTLASAEVTQVRTVAPHTCDVTDGVLTLDASPVVLQLALTAVTSLRLTGAPGDHVLHAIGQDDACLCSFAAGAGASSAWNTALHTTFAPHL